MSGRFIKLYDKILQWEWFGDPNTVCLFIYLLLKANYKETRLAGKVFKRGQVVTSLPKLATDVGLSIRQTRTALEHLKSTGEVTDESTNQYRIITVVKYDDYQNATDKMTGNRQANDRRLDRQTADESTPCIEYIENIEIKNSKNINNKSSSTFTPPTVDDVERYCDEKGIFGFDAAHFIDYYESVGWMVGKHKMKDWKAAIRTWLTRDRKKREQERINYDDLPM